MSHGAAAVSCCVRVIGTCVTCVGCAGRATMTRRGEGGRGGGGAIGKCAAARAVTWVSSMSQDLTGIPSPFDSARFDGPPTKVCKVQVKEEKQQCCRCDYPITKNAASVTCDVCHAIYHLSCAKLRFPPKHGSWACETCMTEMIGSQ